MNTKPKYSLTELIRTGFYYCEKCERIADIAASELTARCPHCKHQTAVWQQPVQLETQN
jgi:DNA-directed RNA polymerase subunit RPC12/RpoP